MFEIIDWNKILFNGIEIYLDKQLPNEVKNLLENNHILFSYYEILAAEGNLGEALYWNHEGFYQIEPTTIATRLYGTGISGYTFMVNSFIEAQKHYFMEKIN